LLIKLVNIDKVRIIQGDFKPNEVYVLEGATEDTYPKSVVEKKGYKSAKVGNSIVIGRDVILKRFFTALGLKA
jgi:hypothetical protein